MNQKKKLSFLLAALPILTVIIMGLMSVVKWKAGMHAPLISSIVVAAIIGKYLGYSWSELEQGLVEGVSRALPAIFILMIVGAIIGTWMLGGIIPTLIYYAYEIINPTFFVPATCFVTAIVATSTGTSFTSMATIGLALMATGIGMGFPAPLVAGAVISGAFFGDKISPLSDTTNLAPAMAGCTLFEHIGHMLWDTLPSMLLALVAYYFVGLKYVAASVAQPESIQAITMGLEKAFTIHPLLLLIPVITIALAVKRVPAVPSLVIVTFLGGLCAMVVQGVDLAAVLKAMTNGYQSQTGVKMLDSLLSRGGINSMGGIILLLTVATALGGILEKIGALEVILHTLMRRIKTSAQLLLTTLFSGLAIAFATGAQLLAIVLPARMFPPAFKEMNLHPKNLSRVSEAAGTVGINLVPWSVPAIFAQNILGVEPLQFIPYLYFVFFVLILNAFYGITGISITKIAPENGQK
ncbi:transporter, NhaC family [Desulforamulus reducens MI-1]|uniref:Transporter, NhaC family n=1 Tax=Desulforamulus reducens (strain ATCC BAA-1160 / DSM 100696 / MI-1) TaxID=349161 RepID=A4J9H5_DESRM|nr:Na+/H+ antiporter NhaC [Desulforamulus reducens]ABO51728.1 transporter, NhaC family [Desulforamulus reducens MI-1]